MLTIHGIDGSCANLESLKRFCDEWPSTKFILARYATLRHDLRTKSILPGDEFIGLIKSGWDVTQRFLIAR